MSKLPTSEKSILFLNNLAGDDLWECGHSMLPGYQKYSMPVEFCKYKDSAKHAYHAAGIHLTSVPYNLSGYGKIRLYGFPFLSIDVNPSDVEYPVPIHGLVVTEDMRMFEYFEEQNPDFINTADPRFSRLAWAKSQNIPTLLAVHHADEYHGDIESLSRLVGMEIFCPVLWHEDEPDEVFLQESVEAIFSEIRQF